MIGPTPGQLCAVNQALNPTAGISTDGIAQYQIALYTSHSTGVSCSQFLTLHPLL